MGGAKKKNEEAKVEKAPVAEVKKAPYVVASGVALTCSRKRILADGEAISADDVDGGKDTFDALVKAELIVKNS